MPAADEVPSGRIPLSGSPNGAETQSPRLARQRLPWVRHGDKSQPQRGCALFANRNGNPAGGHNRVAVANLPNQLPKVARSSQPWAGGRNPFGISPKPACKKMGCARAELPSKNLLSLCPLRPEPCQPSGPQSGNRGARVVRRRTTTEAAIARSTRNTL